MLNSRQFYEMETDFSVDGLSGSSEELFRCQYPIHLACREGNLETLNSLLSTGDLVNHYEEDGFYGWTPIHWAAHFGKLSCIMRLLEHGSSCDATTDRINQSPAHLAALSGKGHCLKWLLQCGAKINRQLACLRKLTTLSDLGCDMSGSQFKQTPLHLSAFASHPHCVQWLVQSGANINSQDYLGETPVHKAARTGSMECISLLVSQGAKLSLRNHRGLTPSDLAAECGRHECAIYIQKAADNQNQSSGGFQDPSLSNRLVHQDLSHLNAHNGIFLPQQQHLNNQIHPLFLPNGITHSGEDCGMEINEVGPGGDAGSHNGFIHTSGMKRCRDDEIEEDSIKRCRKTDPLWDINNDNNKNLGKLDVDFSIDQIPFSPPDNSMDQIPFSPPDNFMDQIKFSPPDLVTSSYHGQRNLKGINPNEMPIKCMMEPQTWNLWYRPTPMIHSDTHHNELFHDPDTHHNELFHDPDTHHNELLCDPGNLSNELFHHHNHMTQKAAFNNNELEEMDNVRRFDSSSIIEHRDSIEVQQGYDSILEAAIIESHGC